MGKGIVNIGASIRDALSVKISSATATLFGLTSPNDNVDKALQNAIQAQYGQLSSTTATLYSLTGTGANTDAALQKAIKAQYQQLTTATANLYGLTGTNANVDTALSSLSTAASFYGKYSQMNTSTVGTTSALMAFSTEENDDFNVINLGTSTTRMTIPAALNGRKVIFYFIGTLGTNGYSGTGSSIDLRKNGTLLQTLGGAGTSTGGYGVQNSGYFQSSPIVVATNDYFEIFAKVAGGSSATSVTATCFGMQVWK